MASPHLMTPGPVPLHPKVLEALGQQVLHHRTPEFEHIMERTLKRLKIIFATAQPCMMLTSTGTGSMEAALVNTLSPGEKVLALVTGKFGERWATMAEKFGCEVTRVEAPWGKAIDLEKVRAALKKETFSAVLCQACETSTGVLNPIEKLAKLIQENSSALFLVDAITALAATELPMDQWGLDVVIGGSQKAFMLPTGLSFISLSKRAWLKQPDAKIPKFYFDLAEELKANQKNQTHFSSAVTTIRALDVMLEMIDSAGLENLIESIKTRSSLFQQAVQTLGFQLFTDSPSPSLTVIELKSKQGKKFRQALEDNYQVIAMGGQDHLEGQILRFGHMGYITKNDYRATLKALSILGAELNEIEASPQKLEQALATIERIPEP